MTEDILCRLQAMNSDMQFTLAVYNEEMAFIEDIFLEITIKWLVQLGICWLVHRIDLQMMIMILNCNVNQTWMLIIWIHSSKLVSQN